MMSNAYRNGILQEVILVLLDRKQLEKQTEMERVNEAVALEAAGQAVSRVGGRTRIIIPANYEAVRMLLARMENIPQMIVDFTVKECLEIHRSVRTLGRRDINAVCAASDFLRFGASKHVANEVVWALANAGFLGRIKEVARRYADRDLTGEEVHALVDSYCEKSGSQGVHEEEYLCKLAQRILPPAEAKEVREKLDNFREEFFSQID